MKIEARSVENQISEINIIEITGIDLKERIAGFIKVEKRFVDIESTGSKMPKTSENAKAAKKRIKVKRREK